MLPEDINDIIIAFLILVLLGSAACVLQSPVGEAFGGGGFTKEAKITTEEYNSNFEENIFLLNYLRTPVRKYGTEFTIADYVFMCKDDDKFKELKEETKKILKDYRKDISIFILCDSDRKKICGTEIVDDRSSLVLSKGYGFEVKFMGEGIYPTDYLEGGVR